MSADKTTEQLPLRPAQPRPETFLVYPVSETRSASRSQSPVSGTPLLAHAGIFRVMHGHVIFDSSLSSLFALQPLGARVTVSLTTVLRAFTVSSRRALFEWSRKLLQRASQAHTASPQAATALHQSLANQLDSTLEVEFNPSLLQTPSQDNALGDASALPTRAASPGTFVLKMSRVNLRTNSATREHRGHDAFAFEGVAFLLEPQEPAKGSQEAETRDLIQGEFLRRMSHELRTPLNIIAGIGDLLLEHDAQHRHQDQVPTPEQQSLLLSQLARATKQMEELVGKLLDFSYMKTAHVVPLRQPFDLSELLVLCWQHYFPRAEDKRIALTFEGNVPEGLIVIGDARLVSELINHQLSNALKFTDSGRIVLSAFISQQDDANFKLRLVVKDTGVGIRDEDARRVFSAFEQAESGDRRSSGGAGLGLFLCQQVANALGSQLTIENETGFATCFATELILGKLQPSRAAASPKQDSIPAFIDHVKDQIHGTFKPYDRIQNIPTERLPLRLLAVDDNEVNLQILKAMLAPYSCSVTFARNGLEAIQEYASATFDVILLDLQMPKMDGYEAVRHIRMLERTFGKSRAIVAAVSASCFSEDVVRARRAGCDDHIAKPVHRRALLEALQRYGFRLDPKTPTHNESVDPGASARNEPRD